MQKLISFIVPSRRLDNLKGLFDNLENTVSDSSCIEVLVKLDDDQPNVLEFIESEKQKRLFDIKYIITPRLEGMPSLWIGMERLFYMTDPGSHFVQLISDEPRFITQNWDLVLRKYIGFFADDIFRLRLSKYKFTNYASHYECTFKPDSFPIYTKRWLELTEGTGDCWGSDAFHQCVAFQLSLGPGGYHNFYREGGLCRDIVVNDIELDGLEFGVGVLASEQGERYKRNLKEWSRLTSFVMQERFSYYARRINCYIWAYECGIKQFSLVKRENRKTVALIDSFNQELLELSYALPRLTVYMQNFSRFITLLPKRMLKKCLTIVKFNKKSVNGALKLNEIIPDGFDAGSQKKRLKYILTNALISVRVPGNFVLGYFDKLFASCAPGISTVCGWKTNIPKGLQFPTENQAKWLQQELNNLYQKQSQLSERTHLVGVSSSEAKDDKIKLVTLA